MSDTTVTTTAPTAQADAGLSNADFARLRLQADAQKAEAEAAKAEATALKAQLEEINRANLTEIERLRLEAEEGKALKGRVTRLEDAAKGVYEAELATIPEAHRATVADLSAMGDWDARLKAVRAAKALIPTSAPAPTPPTPATGGNRDTTGATERTRNNPENLSWGAAVAANKR